MALLGKLLKRIAFPLGTSCPPDGAHRVAVGGLWEELGQLQFELLVTAGLRPHHRMLDIGCGALRGGIHFASYLKPGNYYGVDKNPALLDAARMHELPLAGISADDVRLVCCRDFQFQIFEVPFDFALAHSLFTHLPPDDIRACLGNVAAVLAPNGRLFATFFENPRDLPGPIIQRPGGIVSYPDRDPFHYRFSALASLAVECNLNSEYVGEWGHARGQKLAIFRHSKGSAYAAQP